MNIQATKSESVSVLKRIRDTTNEALVALKNLKRSVH